jgi:cytochrome c556
MPDPSQLDADTLASLKEAALMLAIYSRDLAESETILAAGPDLVGSKVPEGVATRDEIQAAIDADPAGFRALARAMGDEAQAIAAALDDGDKKAVAGLVAGFDGACQSCHERYWYVNQ